MVLGFYYCLLKCDASIESMDFWEYEDGEQMELLVIYTHIHLSGLNSNKNIHISICFPDVMHKS
jgi:hypothetical protein